MADLIALEERRGASDAVDQAIDRLESARTPNEVIAVLRTSARRLIGADGIAIILRDGDECHYVEEDAIGPLWKGSRFPMKSCVSGWAMLYRKTAVIPDILADARVPQAAYRQTFVRSMAMAPFGAKDPRGALGAYWAHKYTPSAQEVRTLEDLAAAAGRALAGMELRPPGRARRALLKPRLKPDAMGLHSAPWLRKLLPRRTLGFAAGAAIDISIAGSDNLPGRIVGWLMFALIGGVVGLVASAARGTLDVQSSHVDALEDRERELASITRELDHRSRNTLAVATALAAQAARSSATTDEMRDKLTAYFGSIAATQALLRDMGTGTLQLRELIARVLLPFVREEQVQIAIDEDIAVPAGREVMLSLAFSELATNACKYGALSAENGQVLLTGTRVGGSVRLLWSESGGPKVVPPQRVSTGSRLVARALADVPGGEVDISYLPAGLTCEFRWLESA